MPLCGSVLRDSEDSRVPPCPALRHTLDRPGRALEDHLLSSCFLRTKKLSPENPGMLGSFVGSNRLRLPPAKQNTACPGKVRVDCKVSQGYFIEHEGPEWWEMRIFSSANDREGTSLAPVPPPAKSPCLVGTPGVRGWGGGSDWRSWVGRPPLRQLAVLGGGAT